MKTLILLFILTIFSLTAFGQNEKCLAFSNKIIENAKGKVLGNSTDDDIYCMKAGFPENLELEALKTICDTTAKNAKVAFNWKLNYDKNYEKEFLVNGKKVLITIYHNDKFLYFEFPKQ
jgi:hypothetical protein